MDMDFAAMGLPTGFGKAQKSKPSIAARFEQTKRSAPTPAKAEPSPAPPASKEVEEGPKVVGKRTRDEAEQEDEQDGPMPALTKENGDAVQDEDVEDVDDEEDLEPEDDLPLTHEILLKDHTKAISALALDPSGARVVSGSHDYDAKLWDFGGMDLSLRPFRSWEPAGSYPVRELAYSPYGDAFLCISGTTQAKLFDKDGEQKAEFIKGDMYIRDMRNTAGHVGELTGCSWSPWQENIFITSSADSTIRIWNAENRRKQKTVIVVKSKERGARTKVTWCGYNRDGSMIAGACADGTIHLWASKSNFVRPNLSAEEAHEKGTDTDGCAFAVDGWGFVSRGGDGTVKLWDTRKFKRPVATAPAPTMYPGTNVTFSPDGKYVVTGTSEGTKQEMEAGLGGGKLLLLKRENLELEREVPLGGRGILRVVWHPKINQILCGHADGTIRVLYSPTHSINGAKLCVPRGTKSRTIEDYASSLHVPILLPEEPGMGRDVSERPNKRRRDKERMETGGKTRRPMAPVHGPGKGGRVGASATQHIVQHLFRDNTRDEDPREALLKYADVADKDPIWTAAWRQNQPKPVFQYVDTTEEKEEDE
ncbi:WD40 repeat-like protein [Dacryopinax primogenitus]|uniref:WD40 repeat-like protein n=1 Tax=Dacryopinax primogenitus (strain DJM 731) TaxID=1858805 RepID=M5FZA1_DACPD|nr:WD40 repeat-like protein [Dacryopinax primogenitus]EJT98901.1 WD40 repeat-like protein [Dacryopinax primogenitus]